MFKKCWFYIVLMFFSTLPIILLRFFDYSNVASFDRLTEELEMM